MRTFGVEGDMLGAVVPIGYADGCSRLLSTHGEMLIRGRRAPIVGRVSMDQTVIDITHIPGAAAGDVVTILGCDGEESVGADDIAAWTGTIPNEVLTRVGERVERVWSSAEGG